MDKVLVDVNADADLPTFKRTTFYLLLKELDFKYVPRKRNSVLTEREDLIVWRMNYLRQIKKFRQEGRSIYFLDETWLNAGDVCDRVWLDTTVKSKKDAYLRGLSTGAPNPTGKGKRLIILHIGSDKGFVPGGLLCFESKKNSADYHDEMNGDSFRDWFLEILPKLDDGCVIIMDNAPYHSVKVERMPNSSWKKDAIIQWLLEKGENVDETLVKAELLLQAENSKHRFDKYLIDEIARENKKTVLRLPPYHCELNPIEMVWSMVKRYVKEKNVTF